MIELTTEADLLRLVANGTQESLNLEYKRSNALGRESKQRNEICKDVSAFANSAGGQLVYGIEERDRHPVRVDEGIGSAEITREWLEQVIDSGVQPRIEGLHIAAILLASGNCAYVVSIPQSTHRAPHQASDHRYYKRQNFQSVPMEDYEVRDVLRRAQTPKLVVTFSLLAGSDELISWPNEGAESSPIRFRLLVGNESTEPAIYTVLTLFLDSALIVRNDGGLSYIGQSIEAGSSVKQYRRMIGPPAQFPIFKEAQMQIAVPHISVALDRERFVGRAARFVIGYAIATPGFSYQKFGELLLLQERLHTRL
jgi:hypothetical protein